MNINADVVLKARKEKSWSQDELAIASGLNLRTIQRIEREASASLQSKKALASALDLDIHDLDYQEIAMRQQWEYKVVETKDRTKLTGQRRGRGVGIGLGDRDVQHVDDQGRLHLVPQTSRVVVGQSGLGAGDRRSGR